jgi:hypothetical protein
LPKEYRSIQVLPLPQEPPLQPEPQQPEPQHWPPGQEPARVPLLE